MRNRDYLVLNFCWKVARASFVHHQFFQTYIVEKENFKRKFATWNDLIYHWKITFSKNIQYAYLEQSEVRTLLALIPVFVWAFFCLKRINIWKVVLVLVHLPNQKKKILSVAQGFCLFFIFYFILFFYFYFLILLDDTLCMSNY